LVALNLADGSLIFQTDEMVGETKGTPVASEDGSVLAVTHNVDGATGYFSVFMFGTPTANLTYTAPSTGNSSAPFGAVGFCYNPLSGSYVGGEGNTNDLFMWGTDTPKLATEGGTGQMFAFQMPMYNAFNMTEPDVVVVNNLTAFETPNPPVFANNCYSMYIAASKSEIRYWVSTGIPRDYFDKGADQTVGFERGSVRWAAAAVPPTLSSNPTQPFLYGPSAASELYRMLYDLSEETPTTILTQSPLTNKVILSIDELYLYFANSGALHQLEASSLDTVWNVTVGTGANVYGEIAQSRDGTYIYVPDTQGMLYAYQVKTPIEIDSAAPSASPSETVIAEESDSPTAGSPASASDVPSPEKPLLPTDAETTDAPVPDGPDAGSNDPSVSPSSAPKEAGGSSDATAMTPLLALAVTAVMVFV
jgi:hypothetical protein